MQAIPERLIMPLNYSTSEFYEGKKGACKAFFIYLIYQKVIFLSQNSTGLSRKLSGPYTRLFIIIILNSATLNTFLLAPSSAGRGGRTISGKQRIEFGAAAGAQQLYSSITQARSGTAIPLNSKAHITARGTFDG